MTKAEGFSLVEVLIASSIVAITFLAIASMFPTAYRNVDWSGERTAAATLGEQRLEWLMNQAYTSAPLAAGTTAENLAGNYAGYTRTTTIVDDVPMVGVKQVTVNVATPLGKNVQLVTVVTE
jgi:prepilin-type N-terminal cleavage/methylation domain-containing protein